VQARIKKAKTTLDDYREKIGGVDQKEKWPAQRTAWLKI
jgi:hypothetical protein